VETVTYEMLDDSIGYIYVMQFDEITTQQFETALNNLKAQGMKGLVVDIRDNGGGLLTTVCDMLDLFLEEEDLIVYTLDKYDEKEEIFAKEGSIGRFPMAILVNGFSASASEIFSGALQDYGLATIVGTQSFGKGIVQSIIPLVDGSAVKLTVSTYYTPKGRNIHGLGITPDVEVELAEELRQMPVVPLAVTPAPQDDVVTALSNIDQLLAAQQAQYAASNPNIEGEATPTPEELAQKAAEQEAILNTIVYCYYGSGTRYYHAREVCGTQSNRRQLTVREALGEYLGACPDCNPPSYSGL